LETRGLTSILGAFCCDTLFSVVYRFLEAQGRKEVEKAPLEWNITNHLNLFHQKCAGIVKVPQIQEQECTR
jgi:hypothetical protein